MLFIEYWCMQGTTWDRCIWKCGGVGEFLQCDSNQVAVGLCGSGSFASCRNPTYCPDSGWHYFAVLCCSLRIAWRLRRNNNWRKTSTTYTIAILGRFCQDRYIGGNWPMVNTRTFYNLSKSVSHLHCSRRVHVCCRNDQNFHWHVQNNDIIIIHGCV